VIVRIDEDAAEVAQGVCPDLGLVGSPASIMQAMAGAIRSQADGISDAWLEETAKRDRKFRRRWADVSGGGRSGREVVGSIAQAVDDETVLLVDGGNIGQWFHMMMSDRYPSRWITCGRSAVVGWGFPSAAAAKSVYPDKQVLLLSGDGASTFTIAEIETAVRQNLPYVAVVADDEAWGIVVSGSEKRKQPPVASKLGSIRFDLVAEGFGARGVRLEDPRDLPGAIGEGFESGQVTVIHMPIQPGGPADVAG